MISHFTTLVSLLVGVIGLLGGLITLAWRARGWVDRLNTTDSDLAHAISDLNATTIRLHKENQARFRRIESKLKK